MDDQGGKDEHLHVESSGDTAHPSVEVQGCHSLTDNTVGWVYFPILTFHTVPRNRAGAYLLTPHMSFLFPPKQRENNAKHPGLQGQTALCVPCRWKE